jgi:hypothetical protein
MQPFGFIIIRHVSNDLHNYYWKHSVECINKHFGNDTPVIIVDDYSTFNPTENNYKNVKVVQLDKEFAKSGEILGYYYAWKFKPFEKFVVLHDSMFVNSKFDILPNDYEVQFLWHFDKYLGQPRGAKAESDFNVYFIEKCKHSESLLELYFDKTKWLGCFGVAAICTLSLINKCFEYYELENVILQVKSRSHREAMERLFALLMYDSFTDKIAPSLNGSILDIPQINFYQYMYQEKNENRIIYKVWSGR